MDAADRFLSERGLLEISFGLITRFLYACYRGGWLHFGAATAPIFVHSRHSGAAKVTTEEFWRYDLRFTIGVSAEGCLFKENNLPQKLWQIKNPESYIVSPFSR